ncbi:MAG: copper chaperone [Candidatus Kapaibacterium sp.]|nr:MAG: copper chaperone [Candidatus Kapabacteria bacterium]
MLVLVSYSAVCFLLKGKKCFPTFISIFHSQSSYSIKVQTMKTSRITRALILFICANIVTIFTVSSIAFGAEKKESIKVWGNCGMCKKTIEKSLNSVEGIKSASWNKQSKILEVQFDDSKISIKQIEEKVAGSGYDTQNVKGDDKAYKNLHECCQYDRKKS